MTRVLVFMIAFCKQRIVIKDGFNDIFREGVDIIISVTKTGRCGSSKMVNINADIDSMQGNYQNDKFRQPIFNLRLQSCKAITFTSRKD